MDGVKTKDGMLRAFADFVLVTPYQDSSGGIIVIRHDDSVKKGTVTDVGADVPIISPGDLIYFDDSFELEKDVLCVHAGCILAFSKLVDDYA